MGLTIAPGLTLPLDWMTMASVVYGARGAGKTTLGRVIAEELWKAGQRFVAIDLKGDWWGLKATADGVGAGIPVVVFGGEHADLPLEDGSGALIGEIVATNAQPFIVDLERMSKGRQVRWLKDFLLSLYDHNRDPNMVLADEIQRYAPQRPMSPDETMCLAAVEDVVKLGRKHGLGILALTQRGAGLNKEVSELCDVLMALRTPGPLDQDRIKEWLDANTTREQRDTVMGKLAKLPTGTAVVASGHPDIDVFTTVAIRRSETFDSSATPKVGQARTTPKVLAPVEIEALRERLHAVQSPSTDTDGDARDLRRALAEQGRLLAEKDIYIQMMEGELRRLREQAAAGPSYEMLQKAAETFVRSDRVLTGLEEVLIEARATRMAARELEGLVKGVGQEPVSTIVDTPGPAPSPPRSEPTPSASKPARPAPASAPSSGLTGPQQRVLDALATYERIGEAAVQRPALAAVAGYKPGRHFDNIVSSLRTAGLAEYPSGGTVALTEQGRDLVGTHLPGIPLADLHAQWFDLMSGPQRTILGALIRAYPNDVARSALARECGYAPGRHFDNVVSSLKSRGAAEYRRHGHVAASALLFPKGLTS